MTKVILVKYGEIAIRGNNRYLFENKLIAIIKKRIGKYGDFIVKKEQGRILVDGIDSSCNIKSIAENISSVFGICGVCIAYKTDDFSVDNISKLALEHMQTYFSGEHTFKVETKRADKRYPIPSQEVSALVGGYIFTNTDNFKVDVRNPEITLMVELRNSAYIYTGQYAGVGGLPVGSTGKAVLMLSGGIDSPVAGYLMAKRGLDLEYIYFHTPPYTGSFVKQKVIDLAERLSYYCGNCKLHVVHFTDIQLLIKENVQKEKMTLLLKRAMLRVAEKIALSENVNAEGIVLGDSVGQVASQTMSAIHAISTAVKLPLIRPLAGFDKQEIVNIAQKIGTYQISIQPYDDCCTLFVAKHPETKPKASIIESIERKLAGLDELIEQAAISIETIETVMD